jgi:CheY-like chemotaxis protein
VITATTTRAAGLALARNCVDAVLLDLLVPADGGIELCRRIRADARLRHLPVIALSALPEGLFAAQALQAGCSAFLQKPCSLARIVAEVRRHLAGCGAGGGTERGAAHPLSAHGGVDRCV